MSLTKEQAIRMALSGWWESMSYRDVAMFQMHEPLMCMPFDKFHEAMEKTLGRPIWTHEFGLNFGLQRKLLGEQPAPSFEEICNLIPAEKRVLLLVKETP